MQTNVLGVSAPFSFWRASWVVAGFAFLAIALTVGGSFMSFQWQERRAAQTEIQQAANFLHQRLHEAQSILGFTSRRLGYLKNVTPGNVRAILDDTPLETPTVLLDITNARWEKEGSTKTISDTTPIFKKKQSSLVLSTLVQTEEGQPKGHLFLEFSLENMMKGAFQRINIVGLALSQDKIKLSPDTYFVALRSSTWGLVLKARPSPTWKTYWYLYRFALLGFAFLAISTAAFIVMSWRSIVQQTGYFLQKDLLAMTARLQKCEAYPLKLKLEIPFLKKSDTQHMLLRNSNVISFSYSKRH